MLLVVPLSLALATPTSDPALIAVADQQTFKHALAEAFGHRSYVLLVLGFFTCGFQLAFITVHLPAYLVRSRHAGSDRRLGDRGDRPVQHHRLAQRRLAAEPVAEALHPVSDLFRPRAVDRGVHLVSDHHLFCDRIRRRSPA